MQSHAAQDQHLVNIRNQLQATHRRSIAYLKVHEDLIAVVSREELPHVGTGSTPNWVQTTVRVHINDDRHCRCVRL